MMHHSEIPQLVISFFAMQNGKLCQHAVDLRQVVFYYSLQICKVTAVLPFMDALHIDQGMEIESLVVRFVLNTYQRLKYTV